MNKRKERLQYLFLRKRQHTALMYIFLVCHACPVVLPSYFFKPKCGTAFRTLYLFAERC